MCLFMCDHGVTSLDHQGACPWVLLAMAMAVRPPLPINPPLVQQSIRDCSCVFMSSVQSYNMVNLKAITSVD